MRAFFIFCTLGFIVIQGLGQIERRSVPIVAYWQKGDFMEYSVTKVKRQFRNDSLVQNDTTIMFAGLTVIDSTADSYTLRWSVYEDNLVDFISSDQGSGDLISDGTLDVIYKTSEAGAFMEITNWKQVSEILIQSSRELIRSMMSEKEPDTAKFNQIIEPVLAMYGSRQGIEQLAFPELQLLHFAFGTEMMVDDTIHYNDQLPNMFGGEPIRASGSLYFSEVDFNKNYCALEQTSFMNPDDTKKMVVDFLSRMNLSTELFEQFLTEAIMDIHSINKYKYMYDPGIPLYIETLRSGDFSVAGVVAKTYESIIIELTDMDIHGVDIEE